MLYKAEYIGQMNAIKEAVWLQRLFNKIQPEAANEAQAIIIYYNNQGAITLVKNPQFHAHTKHIDIQHYFIRDKVSEGAIEF